MRRLQISKSHLPFEPDPLSFSRPNIREIVPVRVLRFGDLGSNGSLVGDGISRGTASMISGWKVLGRRFIEPCRLTTAPFGTDGESPWRNSEFLYRSCLGDFLGSSLRLSDDDRRTAGDFCRFTEFSSERTGDSTFECERLSYTGRDCVIVCLGLVTGCIVSGCSMSGFPRDRYWVSDDVGTGVEHASTGESRSVEGDEKEI